MIVSKSIISAALVVSGLGMFAGTAMAASSDNTWDFAGSSAGSYGNTSGNGIKLSAWVTNDNANKLYAARDGAYYGGLIGGTYEAPLPIGGRGGSNSIDRYNGSGLGIDQDKYDYDADNVYARIPQGRRRPVTFRCGSVSSGNLSNSSRIGRYEDNCYDRDGDEHGIDNIDGDELLVMEFDEAVALHSFELGYVRGGYGSDMSVFALSPTSTYSSGSSGSVAGLNGTALTITSLANKGFELVGHYKNVGKDTARSIFSSVADAFESNVWAIATLVTGLDKDSDRRYDYVKLASIVAKPLPTDVPVPTTLALIALGALLLRRRII